MSEGALYLGNRRIQYIHALCLARHGGEHDKICSALNINSSPDDFESPINWPEGFIELCKSERVGIVPTELQPIKQQAGDDPNRVFPLRDVDVQFKVEFRRGPESRHLGSLSYDQLMREAYPGAVYYYTTQPYRVCRIIHSSRIVEVRPEKRYTTKPKTLPTLVFPNLTSGNVYNSKRYGDLIVIECNLQIRETIVGYREKRGPNEFSVDYPLDPSMGIFFDQPRFTRNFFTTGVILTHPVFKNLRVRTDIIANLLYEAFLMVIPFERRDISFASGKHRVSTGSIREGDKFVCIYDQTYGSLRLSERLLEDDILRNAIKKASEIARQGEILEINVETENALRILLEELDKSPLPISLGARTEENINHEKLIKVIMPGSKGLDIKSGNEEFIVEHVFYSPTFNGLAYRGKHLSEKTKKYDDVIITIPYDSLVEIPGESKIGLYNLETGEIKEIKQGKSEN